ncbi:MAG TPA: urease accessory protein UreD [Rhizomicrobium sp.]|nr:urease accessory protein UreD [Rhizomicrobium sp.]
MQLALARAPDGSTQLRDLYQAQPLRVLFPHLERGEIFQAAIACVSGGLVGGDRLGVAVTLGDGTRGTIIGQAAEKVYRSLGADCIVESDLAVGAGAWLEYLPQETILFEAARLRRRTTVRIADGGHFLGGGILAFGRAARGERLTRGLVHDGWEIRDGAGRLVWKDALHMAGDLGALLANPATFDGAAAYGSLIYAGPAARDFLDCARDIAGRAAVPGLRIGATVVRDLLLVRFVGRSALALRGAFAEIWCGLRAAAGGLPPAMPRLWSI